MSLDIYSMSPDEVMAEVERRREARQNGGPLSERRVRRSRAALDTSDYAMEKQIQAEVVKTYRAFGCVVYSFSQPRRTKQTPGIPDLYVFHPRVKRSWWHETKTKEGTLRPDQIDFRDFCRETSTLHVTGGITQAEDMLTCLGIARRVNNCLESTLSPISE